MSSNRQAAAVAAIETLTRAQAVAKWPLLNPPGEIVTTGAMDLREVAKMYAAPWSFCSVNSIVDEENEDVVLMRPTPTQLQVLDVLHRFRWAIIDKYRQAKTTTVVSRLMLRDCGYIRGMRGLLVAERDDTAKDIFEQLMESWRNLPDSIRPPLKPGTIGAVTAMHFWHGGSIKIQTAGSKSPGIGRGLGWLHITEFGETLQQKRATMQLLPTVSKRGAGRLVIESTPGAAGSFHEKMWNNSLMKRGRFREPRGTALFLRWFADATCEADDTGFEPTPEELALQVKHPDLSKRNLAFRRDAIHTEFGDEPRLFNSKYPFHEYDGWIGQLPPVIPLDALERWLLGAVNLDFSGMEMAWIGGQGPDGRPLAIDMGAMYVIFADPAGYGEAGDPSAMLAFNGVTRCDIGAWSRPLDDPGRFAKMIVAASAALTTRAGPPLVVVESNAMACIEALRALKCPRLLWTDAKHPGWYATDKRLHESESRFIRMARQDDITIRNRPTLDQVRNYDGSGRKGKTADGVTHHFDLARCAVMAGDILGRRAMTFVDATDGAGTTAGGDPANGGFGEWHLDHRPVTIADLDRHMAREKAKRSPLYGAGPGGKGVW